MKVVLDTSIILGTGQSSFRYFSEIIPRLKRYSEVTLEVLPSPYFELPQDWYPQHPSYSPLLPGASWLPHGPVRRFLSKIKSDFESSRQRKALFESENTLFHSFFYTCPSSSTVPLVTIAHDATIEKLRQELGLQQSFSEHLKRKQQSLNKANRIIAVSEATKKDISEIYNIPSSQIDCIYHSVGSEFYFDRKSQPLLDKPYLLQVGGRLHHRNFSRLAEAFFMGKLKSDYFLVCAGEPWSEEEKVLFKKLGIESQVKLIENPPVESLRNLYQHAKMLVYPSLYEGFGFPLVEAMACGTPVATSLGAGSIPEVAGKAAQYFDPRDSQDMAKKISELLDPKTAETYRTLGFENLKRFSWDQTAEKTLETYRKVLSA